MSSLSVYSHGISKLLSSLKKRRELKGKVIFPKEVGIWAFRVQFFLPEGGTEHPIGGVFIAIPGVSAGNRLCDGDHPTIIEVSLLRIAPEGVDFFSIAPHMYVYDPFDYDEQRVKKIFYYSDVDGLVEEILRLCNCLSLPLSAFPLPYDDEFNDESDGYCNDKPNDDSNDLSKDEPKVELNDVLISSEAN